MLSAMFQNIFVFHISIFSICVLTLFYVILGFIVCLITFVLEYIESIENPSFVKFKQFVNRYLRMMFFDKAYERSGKIFSIKITFQLPI